MEAYFINQKNMELPFGPKGIELWRPLTTLDGAFFIGYEKKSSPEFVPLDLAKALYLVASQLF